MTALDEAVEFLNQLASEHGETEASDAVLVALTELLRSTVKNLPSPPTYQAVIDFFTQEGNLVLQCQPVASMATEWNWSTPYGVPVHRVRMRVIEVPTSNSPSSQTAPSSKQKPSSPSQPHPS